MNINCKSFDDDFYVNMESIISKINGVSKGSLWVVKLTPLGFRVKFDSGDHYTLLRVNMLRTQTGIEIDSKTFTAKKDS